MQETALRSVIAGSSWSTCNEASKNRSSSSAWYPWRAERGSVPADLTHNRSDPGDLLDREGLDDVAALQVLVVLQADTALVAGLHFADVVLEALQGGDLALPDDRAVAQEPDLGATGDRPVEDVAAGDLADPRHGKHFPHLGFAGDDLFELRLEHA